MIVVAGTSHVLLGTKVFVYCDKLGDLLAIIRHLSTLVVEVVVVEGDGAAVVVVSKCS